MMDLPVPCYASPQAEVKMKAIGLVDSKLVSVFHRFQESRLMHFGILLKTVQEF
jgi:hypothetical protein